MATPTLHGFVVNLRPLRAEDASLTHAWRSSDRARLLNSGAGSVSDQLAWIESRPANEHNFIIETVAGRPVGMLSIVAIDRTNRHGEPGRFLIGDDSAVRGTPAAIEAMVLLYRFAFEDLDLVRVWGIVAEDNRRMQKWQRYLGMREEGRLRQHLFINGRFQDAVVFGLTREEYVTDALPRMSAMLAMGGVKKEKNSD